MPHVRMVVGRRETCNSIPSDQIAINGAARCERARDPLYLGPSGSSRPNISRPAHGHLCRTGTFALDSWPERRIIPSMRAIQVGVGGFGNRWMEVLSSADAVELAGIVDVNESVLDAQGERYGVAKEARFTDLDAALKELKPELVVCVTPPASHREVAQAAFSAGAHVLTEKPMAGSWSDCLAMVEAAEKADRLFAVSQNYRCYPYVLAAREVLRGGELGEPEFVQVSFFKAPHFGGFREKMRYPLIVDMAIHHYDLMRAFLGDPEWTLVASCSPSWSWFEHDAAHHQLLRFRSGAVVSYTGSWCTTGEETTWTGDWRLECARGTLTIAGDKVFVKKGDSTREVAPPEHADAQERMLDAFVSSAGEGTAPETHGRDNLKSMEMVFKSVESAETGNKVLFEE